MFLGMGGAGSKLAVKLSPSAEIINVSQEELDKVGTEGVKTLAFYASLRGQLSGSRKNPIIGLQAYDSIKESLEKRIGGKFIVSSTGGGSGSGLCSGVLKSIAENEGSLEEDKTMFIFILPYASGEALEYVENSKIFIINSLIPAIKHGNTGNIFLFSNDYKFKEKIVEDKYNEKLVASFRQFYAIPKKSNEYEQIEGHIDDEDFIHYLSKSFYNHFSYFYYDIEEEFEGQLMRSFNPLMAIPSPASWIEILFLLEIPDDTDEDIYYAILEYFEKINLSPVFSVVKNPKLSKAFITISFLHLHHPYKEFETFDAFSKKKMETKVKRSLSQDFIDVAAQARTVDEVLVNQGHDKQDILNMIKRIKSE